MDDLARDDFQEIAHREDTLPGDDNHYQEEVAPEPLKRSKPGIVDEPEYHDDEEPGPADLDPRMKN